MLDVKSLWAYDKNFSKDTWCTDFINVWDECFLQCFCLITYNALQPFPGCWGACVCVWVRGVGARLVFWGLLQWPVLSVLGYEAFFTWDGPFQAVMGLMSKIEGSARVPCLPRFILLVSSSDILLVVSILGMV